MGSSRKSMERTGVIRFANLAKDVVLSPNNDTNLKDSLILGSVEIGNSVGSAASLGWGYKLPNAMWQAGQWQNNINAAYIDDTTDAQDAGTSDFAISTVSVNNDGYVIQARDKFNVVGLTIGTAQNGAGTVEYNYWNGSAWTVLATLATPTVTGTGDVYLTFLSPADWTKLAAADTPVTVSGLTAGNYAIRVRYTTAPVTTAGLVDLMWLVKLVDYVESVADGSSIVFESHSEMRVPYRASIVPYCSTANAANWVNIEYTQRG